MRRTILTGSLGSLAIAAAIAGCSGSAATPTAPAPASAPAASSVEVTVKEWSITPASTSVQAGSVTFDVSNAGPNEVHEMVVVKTDLAADAVPTKADGSIDEEGAGVTAIGEVEDVAVGSSKSVTVDLAPGKYLLLCNIVNGAEVHYQLGMHAAFEVK